MKTIHSITNLKELGILVREWARHIKKEYPLAFPLFLQIFTDSGFEKISEALVETEREKIADKSMEYLFAHRVRNVTQEMFLENSPEEILRYFQDALKFHNAGLVTKENEEKAKALEEERLRGIQERMEKLAEEKRKGIREKWEFLRRIAPQMREQRIKEREERIKECNANLSYLMEHPVESELSKVNSHIMNFQHGFVD